MTRRRVIVVGAGAAGLMAAGQAASGGADVILLEKMERPGRKLLLTGNGRCNLTNLAPLNEFLVHFGPNGRFLRPVFAQFFTADLLDYFRGIGVPTVTEAGGRVFPASGSAQQVAAQMEGWARACGAALHVHSPAARLLIEGGRIAGVETPGGSFPANVVILATGGASYPGTGSTGDGYRLAEAAGHTVIPIRPALVPLVTAGETARRLQGLSLRDVTIRLWVEGQKPVERQGDVLFTHFGLSGPAVLALSKIAVDALRAGRRAHLSLDLRPDLDERALDDHLLRALDAHGKQQVQTLLKDWLPRSLVPVACDQAGIAPDKPAHQVTAAERKRLRQWLKDFRFEISGTRSFAQAIVTAGGVDLREVDPRTLESRRVPGLYFAGEVLDLDADTGGYNLQAAFSTGWVAGCAAARG